MLKLFNTLSKQIAEFKPLKLPKVGFYACGPTVYDYIHIGNARSFIFYDLLRRILIEEEYDVTFVQNITDIEDKIIRRSNEKGLSPQELTEEYTKYFLEDIGKLNILPASVYPKATEHIGKMIKYIEDLIKKGLAYIEADGSVYFDISKFSGYGKLSGIEKQTLKTGTRILSDEYSKDDVQDFALWKSVETNEYGWDSPWGKGRPGWHIECSVMSQEYLGETLDIHTGGIDLLFPHHENEIAQSEGKTGKPFVRYFVHGEHLLINGEKMSKSKGNFYTLRDIEEKGFDPISFRYLTLTAHYRDPLNFTWDSLQGAQNGLNNIRNEVRDWEEPGEVSDEYWHKFLELINNDLNLPQALAVVHEMVSSDLTTSIKSATLLKMDKVLGLGLDGFISIPLDLPLEVKDLLTKREHARESKDFAKADEIRNEIKKFGFVVEDSSLGVRVKKA